jgi:hypothetical protein
VWNAGGNNPIKIFSSLSLFFVCRKLIEWNARAGARFDDLRAVISLVYRRFLRNFYFSLPAHTHSIFITWGPIEIGAGDPGATPPVRRPRRQKMSKA